VPGTGDPDGSIPIAWYSGTATSDLHAFLAQDLDVLVMSLPLTPATTHLLGAEEFAILARRKAFVVNISRGKIFDQSALIDALNDEKLRGAALDVTDPEPLPKDDPLWDAKNVIITPHISGLSTSYGERAFDVLFTNLKRRENGDKMFNLVDRKRGY
jgi:phosphoglycerate dehydrogenase-like enzyme